MSIQENHKQLHDSMNIRKEEKDKENDASILYSVSPDISFDNKPNKPIKIKHPNQYFKSNQVDITFENFSNSLISSKENEDNNSNQEDKADKDTSSISHNENLTSSNNTEVLVGKAAVKRPQMRKVEVTNEFFKNNKQYEDLIKGIHSNKINEQFQKPFPKKLKMPFTNQLSENEDNTGNGNKTVGDLKDKDIQNGMDHYFTTYKFIPKNKLLLSIDSIQEGACGKLSSSKLEKQKSLNNKKCILLNDNEFRNLKDSKKIFGGHKNLGVYFKLKEEELVERYLDITSEIMNGDSNISNINN